MTKARDKEKRVEHLCGMIAQRMLRKELTRGWTTWFEKWETEAREKRMLKAAGQRLPFSMPFAK